MNDKQPRPRFPGVTPGPKVENEPVIDTTPLSNLHLNATIARLLAEEGSTLSVEEARQKAEISLGIAALQPLDSSVFVEKSDEPDNRSYIEDLKNKFESKGKKLVEPILFIEQIYEIRRSINQSPTQANKIQITDDFKEFVDRTVRIHNMSNSLNNNSRFNSMIPAEIEKSKSKTVDRIKKQEHDRELAYRRMFKIDELVRLGVIADRNEVRMLLKSEAITLLRFFTTDRDNPEILDTVQMNRYLKKINQYRFDLQQEE